MVVVRNKKRDVSLSSDVLIAVPLHSHSGGFIIFRTGAVESHATLSGKIWYIQSNIKSNQFEHFYISPSLSSAHI